MNQSSESPSSELNQRSSLPRIAVTIGDPAGVGPEISLKAIQDRVIQSICQPILFGDQEVLKAVSRRLQLELPTQSFKLDQWSKVEETKGPVVLDFDSIQSEEFEPGIINARTGDSSFTYFDQAIDLAIQGVIDGIATGRFTKKLFNLLDMLIPVTPRYWLTNVGPMTFACC